MFCDVRKRNADTQCRLLRPGGRCGSRWYALHQCGTDIFRTVRNALCGMDGAQLDRLFRYVRQSNALVCYLSRCAPLTIDVFYQGVSTRVVSCQFAGNNSAAPEELCFEQEMPAAERNCSELPCGGWSISHSATIEHNHTSRNQWRTGSWGTVCWSSRTRWRPVFGMSAGIF